MNNRIDQRFQSLGKTSRKALVPFITVGDPHPDWTVDIMHELVAAGADIVELGVPFSDPMADGPVIQEASERAIAKGVSLHAVLDCVSVFRVNDRDTPVVLMGYMNPVERYGYAAFARDAAAAGVDGVLMVDCPPEEMAELGASLAGVNVFPICLLAPTTTPERMDLIASQARGYLYYVSFKGITGADRLDHGSIAASLDEIRRHTPLPLAVGFGIKGPETAAAVARVADAVVIGSALVQVLAAAASPNEARQLARTFLAPVRAAMDNGVARVQQ
ncbi:MAG TPA: tryptophan synthase subunit alpha [Xanthomonadales bacterium]|nr:tryptophan synthase subunit alpha [Xanthomonadales bacterium]